MEHTSIVDPSNSLSYTESIGDSEADLIPNTTISRLCITNVNNSTDDDDAESTSGDFIDAKKSEDDESDINENRSQSPKETKDKSIKEKGKDGCLIVKAERMNQQKACEEVVQAQGDAESDRQFWDACIAHGY